MHPPSPSLQNRKKMFERSEDRDEIAILLLAAGSSSRMGQSKQLLLIKDKPLLRKIAEEALATENNCSVLVVLGSNATSHLKVLNDLSVDVIINDDWQLGIGSSLKKGLNFLETKFSSTQAIIVLVCDQPFLTSSHLRKLIEQYYNSNKSIIASGYSNTLGVPCLFGKKYFSELRNLKDNEGAKKLIQLFKEDVDFVEFLNGEVDLDTPEDFERLKS